MTKGNILYAHKMQIIIQESELKTIRSRQNPISWISIFKILDVFQ